MRESVRTREVGKGESHSHPYHVILCSNNDTHTIKPCNGHLYI